METIPIPGPRGLPLIGNILDIDRNDIIFSISRLADTYGEIFKLCVKGQNRIIISTQELMNEVCDEKRFTKMAGGPLQELRTIVNDGLFTAFLEEPNWGIAHRTLMPAFGPLSTIGMFDELHDIASQLVAKWARLDAGEKIDVNADLTRVTLDSIALCAMGKRFNSFYREEKHPFVEVMGSTLMEAQLRAIRPGFVKHLMRASTRAYEEGVSLMRNRAKEMVEYRKANPTAKNDLLNAMIHGKDPKTGSRMTDESIIDNMITFLVAGHETTASMLSFLLYHLIAHPDTLKKLQAEIDTVVGDGAITVQHMTRLPYLEACLRETLRLTPTAPALSFTPNSDTQYPIFLAGGKYKMEEGDTILVMLINLHRDPKVFGEDADKFKPERMLDEELAKLPPNSWKPFGNGQRGCIGRAFAWQESILAIAMLFQNFDFQLDDPSYKLDIQEALTIKPRGFYMRANLRSGIDPIHLEKRLHGNTAKGSSVRNGAPKLTSGATNCVGSEDKNKKPMTILYGSNTGTCEALAQSLARMAGSRGFNVKVDPLDSAANRIPKHQPVIVICPSYEGEPPDNGARFVTWLNALKEDSALSDVRFAVFGVGNRDWTTTFHKVPRNIDRCFCEKGATRIAQLGLGDVANGDIFNDFDNWQDNNLWPAINTSTEDDDTTTNIILDIDHSTRRSVLRQDVEEAIVLGNEVLTAPGEPAKRHITLQLPKGMEYKPGEYLAILPMNSEASIRRVLRRFALSWDANITIKGAISGTTLPTAHPIPVMELLRSYIEIGQIATKRNLQIIAACVPDKAARERILQLAATDFETSIKFQRLSVLDILEANPSITLPFSEFLAMLPPMRIRQYSISSSPLFSSTTATITFSVLNTQAPNGKPFLGVSSTFLSSLEPSDHIHVAVKPTHKFNLPKNPETTPIIMTCAGSGLAPFRGFIQERASQKAANPSRTLAPAYLFIGCTHPDRDVLFSSELRKWEKLGIVKIFYAYSRAQERSEGFKYVQDRLWAERKELQSLVFGDSEAKIYVCGASKMGEGIKEVVKRMFAENAEGNSEEDVEEWFRGLKEERFAMDVFD